MNEDLIDDSSVLLARNETQERAILKLRDLLKRLRSVKPPHQGGMMFPDKAVDARGNCRLRIIIREGLRTAQTFPIEFNVLADDYGRVIERILAEYQECVRALFLSAYAPDLYNAESSPVTVETKTPLAQLDLM